MNDSRKIYLANSSRRLAGMERVIYFDHNSTAPYSPSVEKYIAQGAVKDWGNASAGYPQAQALDQNIKECRQYIAEHLNCSAKYLFFTSCGTESINTVLSSDTLKINGLQTIISSHLEHHAVIKKIDYLSNFQNTYSKPPQSEFSLCSKWVTNNKNGEINLGDLEKLCSKHPCSLVSLLSSNNETGVITNIKEVSKIAKKYNCLVHADAVQSLGKENVNLEDWGVDFASFSGHKIGAMKGIGLLYAKKPFMPLMYGGGQEKGLRPGTYNFPAIHSFRLAVQDIDLEKQQYVKELRDYFEAKLISIEKSKASGFKINCQKTHRLPNTSSVYCGGLSNQAVLFYLAKKNIYVSAGSACNANSPEPSYVIAMLNIGGRSNKDYARSCIRVSFASSNSKQEVDFLIQSLREMHSKSPMAEAQPAI